jgi:hypothetical protein
VSLVFAVPDHPWTKATRDSAAVRIAMTVAAEGRQIGNLLEVQSEAGLDTDTPRITVALTEAMINPDLTAGSNPNTAVPLAANRGLSSRGVQLMGSGFIVTEADAVVIGWHTRPSASERIKSYRNGRDLLQRSRDAHVIDLFGLSEREVRQNFPELYQYLLSTVKPERDPLCCNSRHCKTSNIRFS